MRAALVASFSGQVEGTSTPDEVAEAVVAAATDERPRTRYVVGAMAQQMIDLRTQLGDEQWDDMMTTMYVRPTP